MLKILGWILSLGALCLGLLPLVAGFAMLTTGVGGSLSIASEITAGIAAWAFAFLVNPLSHRYFPRLTSRWVVVIGCVASCVIGTVALVGGYSFLDDSNLPAINRQDVAYNIAFYAKKHAIPFDPKDADYYSTCLGSEEITGAFMAAAQADGDTTPMSETVSQYLDEFSIDWDMATKSRYKAREFMVETAFKACAENKPAGNAPVKTAPAEQIAPPAPPHQPAEIPAPSPPAAQLPATATVTPPPLNLPQTPTGACASAVERYQKLMCADPGLMALDARFNALYQRAVSTAVDSTTLRSDQRQWIEDRAACRSAACLRYVYRQRIVELNRWVSP